MNCPYCNAPFTPTPRQTSMRGVGYIIYCSGRCKRTVAQAQYRERKDAAVSRCSSCKRRSPCSPCTDCVRWEHIYREKFEDPSYYGGAGHSIRETVLPRGGLAPLYQKAVR